MADWYPTNMDARAAWHKNFSTKLPAFAAKYNISAADQSTAAKDSAWMDWIVTTRHGFDTFSQQVTKYFNDISGNDPSKDQPTALAFALTASPGEPKPGMEFRTREWARQIKGTNVYSQADGEALGIVSSESTPDDPGTFTPEFTVKTLANFELEVSFRKRGMDALKFQFRHKGGEWLSAGFLTNSPGKLHLVPSTPGQAEQVELRAIYVEKNAEVGNYTDAKPAFIAP